MNTSARIRGLSQVDLTNSGERFALARRIVSAAEQHAENTREADFLQGDLEIVLDTLMGEMSPDQVRAAFARLVPPTEAGASDDDDEEDEVDAADSDGFADLPEFAFLGR